MLPRPLGLAEALGLTLNEAVPPPQPGQSQRVRTGSAVFQPQIARGRGGEVSQVIIPLEALQRTAEALARLHTSPVQPASTTVRSGAKEVRRLRERAGLLEAWYPAQADEIRRLSHTLAAHLESPLPDAPGPAHGGFKSSQLLFSEQQVYVVDFDGFCLADPALDVGYFLAYLRPSGLWYQRPGTREWFEGAAAVFRRAYAQAMRQRGAEPTHVEGILKRAYWYEAALLFKIATRRVNRLQSARPAELGALLNEVAACLAG
jgi:aminoglycoside phosphotransferase (APT) family kinase protein